MKKDFQKIIPDGLTIHGNIIKNNSFCAIDTVQNKVYVYYKTQKYDNCNNSNYFVRFSFFTTEELCNKLNKESEMKKVEEIIKAAIKDKELKKMNLGYYALTPKSNNQYSEKLLLMENVDKNTMRNSIGPVQLDNVKEKYFSENFFNCDKDGQHYYEPLFLILFENDQENEYKTLLSTDWDYGDNEQNNKKENEENFKTRKEQIEWLLEKVKDGAITKEIAKDILVMFKKDEVNIDDFKKNFNDMLKRRITNHQKDIYRRKPTKIGCWFPCCGGCKDEKITEDNFEQIFFEKKPNDENEVIIDNENENSNKVKEEIKKNDDLKKFVTDYSELLSVNIDNIVKGINNKIFYKIREIMTENEQKKYYAKSKWWFPCCGGEEITHDNVLKIFNNEAKISAGNEKENTI